MARHYSTRDFFRQMPNALLARYFQARGLFGELDFAAMKETQPDELFAAWLYVPDNKRNEMDTEFRVTWRYFINPKTAKAAKPKGDHDQLA